MLIFRNEKNRKMIENQEKTGKIARLAVGIYTSDLNTDADVQVRQNIVKILSYLRPGSVISYNSAIKNDFGMSDGVVFLTDADISQNYIHELPGLKVLVTPGQGHLPGDADLGGISVSSVWRAAIENNEPRRVIKAINTSKQATRGDINAFISKHLTNSNATNGFISGLDMVVAAASKNNNQQWVREKETVTDFIAKKQANDAAHPLHLSPLIDHQRIILFENLAQQLKRGIHGNQEMYADLPDFPSRPKLSDNRFLNLAFFESYFSNYIEGTEFTPEDAMDIVSDEKGMATQSRDGHDIAALYKIYAKPESFLLSDTSPTEFIENLKYWHAAFAGGHPDKESIHPGQFKDRANRAGSTWFTDPVQVEGTLRAAWEIGETLKEPFDKAIFRAASTVSIHPFLDGNGRITRLAASNVLGRAGKLRLMIPNVFREDYILAVRAFSSGDVVPIIRMFKRAMEITASVPFDKDFPELTKWLKQSNAFSLPEEAKWIDQNRSVNKPRC